MKQKSSLTNEVCINDYINTNSDDRTKPRTGNEDLTPGNPQSWFRVLQTVSGRWSHPELGDRGVVVHRRLEPSV